MIIKLLPDQIPDYWEVIRFASIQVQKPINVSLYCRNLLKNLLCAKYQAWLVLSDKREIKGVLITRILVDVGDIPSLLVDIIYGYSRTTAEEKKEAFETMKKFAQEIGCSYVVGLVGDPAIARIGAEAVGMQPRFTVYSMPV